MTKSNGDIVQFIKEHQDVLERYKASVRVLNKNQLSRVMIALGEHPFHKELKFVAKEEGLAFELGVELNECKFKLVLYELNKKMEEGNGTKPNEQIGE